MYINARDLFKKLRPDLCMKNKVVHHIDGNCENNSPGNLVLLTVKEHRFVHVKMGGYIDYSKTRSKKIIKSSIKNLESLLNLYNEGI